MRGVGSSVKILKCNLIYDIYLQFNERLNDSRKIYYCISILVSVRRFSTIPICKDYIKFTKASGFLNLQILASQITLGLMLLQIILQIWYVSRNLDRV